ncbi:MAG: formyltetrahydrofolate deformylase, partial [Cellulomonas sp. 14-74-6]
MSPTTDTDATAWVLTLSCPDRPGIVAAVAGLLAEHGGNITESQQFGDADSGLFFMRVQVTAAASREALETALTALAERFDLTWELDVAGRAVRTLVMVSTAAHCLNDLAFRQRSEGLPIDIVAVVSNHEVLRPLAEFYDIDFHHLPVSPDTKAQAEARLLELVDQL